MVGGKEMTSDAHSRLTERAGLIRIFENGNSVQMLAPRRIGKTWLMHAVASDLRDKDWNTVFVDVEGMRAVEEFLRELCHKLEEANSLSERVLGHLKQRLNQCVGGWEGAPINAIGHVDVKSFSDALVAALNKDQRRTLILVDEIALFVMELQKTASDEAKAFLYHLRKLRQSYPKVLWLFTGSIGLDAIARRHQFHGALVDLDIFVLKPFDESAARSYIQSLCDTNALPKKFKLGTSEFSYLAMELGWLAPFYLKLIADRINPTGINEDDVMLVQKGDIDRAFEELLSPNRRGAFSTWEEHIDKNFPKDESVILHAILHESCEDSQGLSPATLMARLQASNVSLTLRNLMDHLTSLHNSGILQEVSNRWRFQSGLLRRYWEKYLHE